MSLRAAVALALALLSGARGAVAEEPVPAGDPTPKAVEALRLLTSEDAYQRQVGFLRLEALREPATIDDIRPYADSRDPEMRSYALRALAAIQGPQAIPLLLDRLRAEKHARVRRAALLGLEPLYSADPSLLPVFISALRDRSTEVRMAAVDVVSRIDHPDARAAILVRKKRERRRDVRRVLELAMRRLGGS